MTAKGIILSGGYGTRLRPLTNITNKQLLPINKRPIIDYSINTLIDLGCKDITIILGGEHFQQIASYLKDGKHRGVNFSYRYQEKPNGIAAAINLCKSDLENEKDFTVILGDNIFSEKFQWKDNDKAQIALISSPELLRFGVASVQEDKIHKIVEKPKELDSAFHNYAVTGIYKFTHKFFEYFNELKPSWRDEYEVSEILAKYLADGDLDFQYIQGSWIDCGTFESIDLARELVKRTGLEETLR